MPTTQTSPEILQAQADAILRLADNWIRDFVPYSANTGLGPVPFLHEQSAAYYRAAQAAAVQPEPEPEPVKSARQPVLVCASPCRHECGECRLGLGTHLPCDPRCVLHDDDRRKS